ncbi:MAG TPA: zinc ABC transporter solute-binding protein [Corynebacteriales bacterium]|nr:zinc ABC transporter solute-binding protein [Mycobacteriales bacterium]
MSWKSASHHGNSAGKLIRRIGAAALGLVTAVTMAGCGSGDPETTEITIVSSTNVYGSVAKAIAGNYAKITSIIEDPSADPHSYEASPQDIAKLRDADIAIVNGGGYDQFAVNALDKTPSDKIINAYNFLSGDTDVDEVPPSLDSAGNPIKEQQHGGEDDKEAVEDAASTAASISAEAEAEDEDPGHHHHHDPAAPNEHVFYNVDVVEDVAESLAQKLTALDPTNEVTYKANLESFTSGINKIRTILDKIADQKPDSTFVQTEPLATFLAASADMQDVTPKGYAEAIEEGADVPAILVAEMEDLLKEDKPDVFLFNVQNANKTTQEARKLAQQNDVPVLKLSETLPEGKDYITWMQENATALAEALDVDLS